jgi:magnesium transporter
MARFLKKRDHKKGEIPGSLTFVGILKMEYPKLRMMDYTPDGFTEKDLKSIEDALPFKSQPSVSWINIYGVHDGELMRKVGESFNVHPLILEDIMDTDQRPRFEEKDNEIFIVMKMLRMDDKKKRLIAEQISFVCGEFFLITFQEQVGDVFEPVRERIRNRQGRIRTSESMYLTYALLDMVIDNYMMIIEHIGEQIEDLEVDILKNPTPQLLARIHNLKIEINYLRKSIRPCGDLTLHLMRSESALITPEIKPFLQDLADLARRSVETIDTYRDVLSDQLNIYHSSVSNKMNEVMKVLTIFAAIFIPLTFIAGIYGTNFEYLPELKYKYSYFIFWGVLISVALSMVVYFRKKGWF